MNNKRQNDENKNELSNILIIENEECSIQNEDNICHWIIQNQWALLLNLVMCLTFLFFKLTPVLFATNKLASQYSNSDSMIDCNKNTSLKECVQANKDTLVIFSSVESLSCLLVFILSPTLGRLSDSLGRKPFLNQISINLLIFMVLFQLSVEQDLSIQQWIIYTIPINIITYSTIILMMISDVTPLNQRASIFGVCFVSMFILLPIVSVLIAELGIQNCFQLMYCITFLQLIMTVNAKETLHCRLPMDSLNEQNPFSNISIIFRNKNLIGLSLTLFIFAFISNGLIDVMRVYTLSQLNFSQLDYTIYLTVACMSGLIASMPNIIQQLLGKFGHKKLLIWILLVGITTHIIIPLSQNKQLFQILNFINGFTFLVTPIIQALKSILVDEHEQGKIQGVMGGITSVANGFAPIVFSYLFKNVSMTAPFYFQAIIEVISLLIVIFILDLDQIDDEITSKKDHIKNKQESKVINSALNEIEQGINHEIKSGNNSIKNSLRHSSRDNIQAN